MDTKGLYAFSKKIISLIFVVFFIVSFCSSEQNIEEGDFYQWQFHKIYVDEEIGYIYDIFIYDSISEEKHYIMTLSNHLVPKVRVDKYVKMNDVYSNSVVWTWWAGGGVGSALFLENSELKVYKTYFDESSESFVDNKILYQINIGEKKLYEKDSLIIEVPVLERELRLEKKHIYGNDVFFLQSLMVYFYSQIIEIDGYFGKQTETAVKEIQKKKNLPITGIVNELVWKEFFNNIDY